MTKAGILIVALLVIVIISVVGLPTLAQRLLSVIVGIITGLVLQLVPGTKDQ